MTEIDAALDTASDLKYLKDYDTTKLEEAMVRGFKMICRMIEPK